MENLAQKAERKPERRMRESGIELLKVFAIFMIVLSHVVQTLGAPDGAYRINLALATADANSLILSILHYSGALGNLIFFVCSAWFLLNVNKWNLKKLLYMWLEVWSVSVIILGFVLLDRKNDLRGG